MVLQVLLVEDSPGDVRLTQEAFRGADIRMHVAFDGVEAMAFLRHEGNHGDAPRPDLILLDLNLPRIGRPRGPGPDQGDELLPQQADAPGRLREPHAKHQRLLAHQGQASAAAPGPMNGTARFPPPAENG